jgi:hypothetical protein
MEKNMEIQTATASSSFVPIVGNVLKTNFELSVHYRKKQTMCTR